jgi:hypothetical protein
LPPDTKIVLDHGTGITEYELGDGPSGHVLLCRTATRAGEPIELADGAAAEAVLCDLWTDGTADVVITASGYPTLSEQLDARLEGRCLVTREVTLTLDRGDAGP